MTLTRIEKEAHVEKLGALFSENPQLLLVENQGLSVSQINDFRSKVRDSQSVYRVDKNTLSKCAAKGTDVEKLDEFFCGPVGIVGTGSDAVALAKVVMDFIEENPEMVVKAGLVDGDVLTAAQVETLSKMPSMDELRSKIIGLLQANASKLLRLFKEPARGVAACLAEHGKQN